MPILKQQSTRPLIRDAIVLDLGDLGRQAAKLRAAAEAKAQRILDDAKAEAEAIIAAAHQQGYDTGFAQGQAAGQEAGHQDGHAKALAEGTTLIKQSTTGFMAVAQQWDQHRDQLDREARQAVLTFAIKLARKLTHRIVETDASVVVDQVGAALSRVLEPTDVVIRIHPDDRPTLREALPDLLAGVSHLNHVTLQDDPDVGRAGCVLSFNGGEVDATLDTQMRRIVEVIAPDHAAAAPEASLADDAVSDNDEPADPTPHEPTA